MLNAEEWLPYCANAKKVAIAVILVEWVFIFSILLSFLFLLQNKIPQTLAAELFVAKKREANDVEIVLDEQCKDREVATSPSHAS